MCLALCLGVVCFALAGNAWAGTTSLASGVTVPSTYAQEATITPIKVTPIGQFVPQQYGNTYKLVNNASYSSDIYRNMGVTRTASQDFYVVVSLPANVYFQSGVAGQNCPAGMTCRLPLVSDISVVGGGGAATFSMLGTTGTNGMSYVTYLADVTTDFTSPPTIVVAAGTNGWTIRDFNNKLSTAGDAGAISITVQTYDAVSANIFDGGNDSVVFMKSAPAVMVTQALSPTTAVINSSTLRTSFTATAPDTATQDNGASMGIGYASPVPLNVIGNPFALAATDKISLSITSSNNDFSGLVIAPVENVGLPQYPGTIPGLVWGGIAAIYSTGTTKTLNVAGNNPVIGGGTLPFVFTVDSFTTLVTRTISVKVDAILAVNGGTTGGGTKSLVVTTPVTQWMLGSGVGQVVLLANWLNGNTSQFNSRIYLYNASPIPTDITARVIKMPAVGSPLTSDEITTPGSPIALGTLSASSGMKIDLKTDILSLSSVLARLPGGALPYIENGGNLMVEITAHGVTSGLSGTCQVFSGSLGFGQVPLVPIVQ